MTATVVIDERRATPEDPFGTAILRTLDAGCRARLKPDCPAGFYLVRNGPALLAHDRDGTPVGTFSTLMVALADWRKRRGLPVGVGSGALPPPRIVPL